MHISLKLKRNLKKNIITNLDKILTLGYYTTLR